MNSLLALFIIFFIFAIGDIINVKTKAMVSMMMVAMVLFFVGFRTGLLPSTIFADSGLTGIASFGVTMLLTHIGSTIDLRNALKEWKTVVVALSCTLIMTIGICIIGPMLFDRQYAIAGAPIVAGGIISCLVMQQAPAVLARPEISAFCSIILAFQAVIGIPIASVLAKRTVQKLSVRYHNGDLEPINTNNNTKDVKRLIPELPKQFNSDYTILAKVALVGFVATCIGQVTGISALVWALILGIVLREIGFLDEGALVKANAFTWLMAASLYVVFDGVADADMQALSRMAFPLIMIMVIGVALCAISSILVGKLFKFDAALSFAMGLAALYGFPSSYLIAEEVTTATAQDDAEREYLMAYLAPKLMISGFVQMSIVSGIVAGFLVPML